MSTHNLCFEQKYEKYQIFLSENFHIYFGFENFQYRRVFIIYHQILLLNNSSFESPSYLELSQITHQML